jgi:hypothetical protein
VSIRLCSGLGWNNWVLKKLFCGRYKEVRRLAGSYSMYLKRGGEG